MNISDASRSLELCFNSWQNLPHHQKMTPDPKVTIETLHSMRTKILKNNTYIDDGANVIYLHTDSINDNITHTIIINHA